MGICCLVVLVVLLFGWLFSCLVGCAAIESNTINKTTRQQDNKTTKVSFCSNTTHFLKLTLL